MPFKLSLPLSENQAIIIFDNIGHLLWELEGNQVNAAADARNRLSVLDKFQNKRFYLGSKTLEMAKNAFFSDG